MTKRMVFNFYFSSSNVGQASRLSTLTNINIASSEELIKVLQINKPLAQKIIQLRDELEEFKEPKDLFIHITYT